MVGMFQVIPRMAELSLVKNVIKVKRSFCGNTLLLAHHGNKGTNYKYTEIKNIFLALWFKQVLGMKNARIS